jgi:hypothetical protein
LSWNSSLRSTPWRKETGGEGGVSSRVAGAKAQAQLGTYDLEQLGLFVHVPEPDPDTDHGSDVGDGDADGDPVQVRILEGRRDDERQGRRERAGMMRGHGRSQMEVLPKMIRKIGQPTSLKGRWQRPSPSCAGGRE